MCVTPAGSIRARVKTCAVQVVVESVCHPSWLHSSKSKNLCCTSSGRRSTCHITYMRTGHTQTQCIACRAHSRSTVYTTTVHIHGQATESDDSKLWILYNDIRYNDMSLITTLIFCPELFSIYCHAKSFRYNHT